MTDTVHQAPDDAQVIAHVTTATRDAGSSPHLIGQLPDIVMEALTAWQNRTLDAIWPVIYVEELPVRIGAGQAVAGTMYVVSGVDCAGAEHVLGLWPAPGADDSVPFWTQVLGQVTARGVADVCLVSCDGAAGLADAVGLTWPRAICQTRVLGLIRTSRRYGPRRSWAAVSAALQPVYTAPDEASAAAALDAFAGRFGQRYPALVRLWRVHWAALAPFLALPIGVRHLVYTTPLLDYVDVRLRAVADDQGPFPSVQAAVEALYLAIRDVEEADRPRTVVDIEQRGALRAVGTYFDGRLPTK